MATYNDFDNYKTKKKTSSEPDLYTQQMAALNNASQDKTSWQRYGEGVYGSNGETAGSLYAEMLESQDRDAAYDRVSTYKPSDPGVAEAIKSFTQDVDNQRAEEERRAQAEAAAQLQAAMGGYGGGQTQPKTSSVNFTPSSVPASVTDEFDRRIRELQNAIQAAGEAGNYNPVELNNQLKQAKADRQKAIDDYAASSVSPDVFIENLPDLTRAASRDQKRETGIYTAPEYAQRQADQPVRTEADIWNDLYIAQGENRQDKVEALQKELAQRQALSTAQELGSIPSPESSDPVAPTDRERVDEFNSYESIDTRDLGSKIAALENVIRDAEGKKEQLRAEATRAVQNGYKQGDSYYDSLERRYNQQDEIIDDAERKIAEYQKQIDSKTAYTQSLSPQQRSDLQNLSKRISDIDEAQAAVYRAEETYNQAKADVQAATHDRSVAKQESRYYSDMYKLRVDQLNALVQQYKYRSDNHADQETLDILYAQIQEAQSDVNILENAIGAKQGDITAAAEEYNKAAESLVGAQNALGITQGHLGNTIGRYYDALNSEYTVNDEYRKAYENVQGLDVLISGYERKMENAVTAEEVAAYTEKLRELKRERANNEAYAFEYEMSRALAEMSARDLHVFRELVENKQFLESISNDIQNAAATGDYSALGSLIYQVKEETSDYEIFNLYRDYVKKLGKEKYDLLLSYVEREENRRKQEDRVNAMKNASTVELIGASAASVVTNLLSAPGVISEIIVQSALSDAPIDVNAPGFTAQNLTRTIRGTTGERIEQAVKDAGGGEIAQHWANTLYSTLMSGIDSLVAAGISGGIGGWAGEAVLGVTAATNAAQEAVERGDTVGSAVIRGLVAGTFETLFEHLSIENILDTKIDFKEGLKKTLKKFGNQALSEGSEEFFTELANMAYDGLIWYSNGKSELSNRYEELKAQYNLTDSQANKAFAVELALWMNLPAEWALGLDMIGQAAEAGISGALMGVSHTALLSIAPLNKYLKDQKLIRSLGIDLENDSAADMYVQLQDAIRTLPPEYWPTLPEFREGVTTTQEVQGYARQVRDAMQKYNAEMKAYEEAHPEEAAEARRKAQELADINVTTAANMDEVRSNAEAGAAAGIADAQNAREGARTAQEDVSRETNETTPGNETDESEAFNSLADEEARTVLSGLQSRYSGERLTNEVNREAERLIEQGGTDADRGRALLRIFNGETSATGATNTQSQTAVQTPAWAEGLDAQDVQTVNDAVRNVVRGATERDGSINAQFAQDIINDEMVRLQAAGREDLVAPFNAAVQSAIAGGNENGNLRYDENAGRASGTNSAEQGGIVAGSTGEEAGTAGSAAEPGEQRRAETGSAGQTGGSERVTQTAQTGETAQSAPEGATDMSDLVPGAGKKGNYVQIVSSEQGGEGYRRRYRRIADKARKAGYKVTFVKGQLVFEDNGKEVRTNGAIDTATGEIWLQVDDPDFTVEQLYEHEFYHGLDAQTKADVTKFVEEKYGTRLNAVLADYAKDYDGADADADYLKEELCADIYAGMDRYNWGQKALQQDVRAIVDAGRSQRDARPEATQTQQETRKGEAGEATFDPVPGEKNIQYSGGEETVVIDPDGKRYSIKSSERDILEGKFQKDLKRVLGYTDAQVDALVKGIQRIIDVIKPHRDILDLNEEFDRNNRPFSPYKPNSDPLYKISLDYSTLCRKRLMTQFIISKLQIQQDRALSAEEQIAVRDMLVEYSKQEKALQVACAMCYVEAARLKSPGMINAYLDDPTAALTLYFAKKNKAAEKRIKAYQEQFKIDHGYAGNAPKSAMSGADVSEMNAESRRMRENYEPTAAEREVIERAKSLPRSTYLSPENLANLAAKEPTIYDAYTAWVRSATRSKALEADVPYYYGDSNRKVGKNGKKVSDKFIESVNRENGMRESSWSDAQMTHLLDHIMAVIDLSVRGSAMHGYTKFVEQVRMFGETGEMWNMSGVAGTQNGLNGKLDPDKRRLNREESLQLLSFSDTESVNVEEALDARDEFPETAGLQCIGVSDDHIRALLRSEIIDYVIPYHTSGLNAILRRMVNIFGWDNYQDIQEAHPDGSEPNENSDKANWHREPVFSEFFVGYDTGLSGEEAMRASADNYIRMCRERGLKPKFEQFTDEDGYWKLLIDRKMVNQKTGELIRQKPVQPIFEFGRIEAEIERYVANYDSGLQDRALEYITDHWEEIPGRIETLKQNGTVEETIKQANKAEQIRRQALKKAELLANEMLAAQTNDVETDTPRASGRNLRNSMSSRSNEQRISSAKTSIKQISAFPGNTIRFSRATRDDINADIDAGYAADEDAEEPTASAKMASVAGGKLLDERARDAYDKALANGDRELADKIRKQRAAEDKARGLYREINMERKAYNADGDVSHLNNINRLQTQARDARREANKLAKDTKLDVEARYTPTQAMKQTESKLMATYSVPRGERAKTRARIRNLLNTVYLNGYVDGNDAFKLLSDMYDISTDYIAPDPAYDDIAGDLRGKHVYVTPQVRALFGDEWNQIRREYYSYGIYLTTRESGSDVSISEAYNRNADKYPAILSPTASMDDERIYSLLYALQLSEGADVSLGEAAEMKSIDSEKDFEARLNEALGILKEFADAANIEVRFRAKRDMDVAKIRARFQEKEQLASERRAHTAVLGKVQRELDRIYKRAKVSEQYKVRLASEQNTAIRESVEDMLDDLNEVAKSIMGNDVNLTTLKGVVEWLTQTAEKLSGFDSSGYEEGEGGELTRAAKELKSYMENNPLDIETLQDLLSLLRMIEHHLKIANEMVGDNFESVGGTAPQLTKELQTGKKRSTRGLKAKYYVNEDFMSYSRNLKRYSDWNPHGVMYHMAENLERGDMDYMSYREGADMVLFPFLDRRNNARRRAWLDTAAGRDAKLTELTLPAAQVKGRGDAHISETVKVQVTQMMLVQMYLDLRNEDNLRHIENGGYTFLNQDEYKKGHKEDSVRRGVTVKLSEDQMRDITDKYLTAEGKEFAELLFQYYNVYAKPLINAVSRAIDGRDRANTPNYYPIRSDDGYLTNSYNVFQGSLEGMGPLTERTKGAVNAILLVDADETFQWHKEMMARYVGYAKPLRDLRTLLNYSDDGMAGRKNSDLLGDKYTSNANQLMKDLFAMLETAQFEKAKTLSKIFGNYISNVLTANVSSMLKQFAALPLAGTSFGMEPIMYALSPKGLATKIDTDLIKKYTSYLDDRAAGLVYDQVTDIVRGTNGFTRKVMGQVGSARYITWQTALGRNWLAATDYWANKQMWIAAQHYVDTHTNLKPGTQAEIDSGNDLYYKKVAEVFNRMTFDTQTNSNMMSKPNILRRVDSGIKAFTLFKTDAFQIYGITREMLGQLGWALENGDAQDKHDAKLKVLHGFEGIIGASVVQAVMKYLANLIRRRDKDYRDEEGNFDWKKFGKHIGVDTLENMMNMMAFGEDIYSVIMAIVDKDTKWYDKETAALDAINQMVSALTTNVPKLIDFFSKMSAAEDKEAYFDSNLDAFTTPFKKILWQIAAFSGIPAANYEKNLLGALGWLYPEAAAQLQSFGKATQKSDISNKSELKAYMKEQVGQLSDAAIDAYWSAYEAFGKDALPGFGEPEMKDENGKKRDMTDEEFAKWDYTLRTTMIDAVESVVNSSAYAKLTDDEKEQVLSAAADYARQAGREAVGLDTQSWYARVQNAMTYGAELGNALAWNKLKGSNQAEKFAALERLDIPDEQKAAILHGVYNDISKAKDWLEAADSMTDMQFLEFARDKLSAKVAELETYTTGSAEESAPTPAAQPVPEAAAPAPVETPAPEPEAPKADPLQPEYDKAVAAGMSEDGAKAAVQAVKAAGGNEEKERVKQAAAVGALDSVEDQLAAIRYYSEKPEANYARYSRANDYGVTPADFFDFWKDLTTKYDASPKQTEAQAVLDSHTDMTQEQKAVMWQLCGANWAARNNPYAQYVGEQIKEAYDANK